MPLRVFFCALPLLLFAFTGAAHAQFAIYGMGSGGFVGNENATQGSLVLQMNGTSAYGGTFGVYDDFKRFGPLKLGADARYFQQTKSNNSPDPNTQLRGGTGGLRLALKLPVLPLKPYVQAEIGAVSTNYGYFGNSTGSFAYQVQGGVDYTIFPHLDLRAEYGGGQIGDSYNTGAKQALQEVGLGLVVRFF